MALKCVIASDNSRLSRFGKIKKRFQSWRQSWYLAWNSRSENYIIFKWTYISFSYAEKFIYHYEYDAMASKTGTIPMANIKTKTKQNMSLLKIILKIYLFKKKYSL